MNITKEIQDAAKERGLDLISTGGGFDYVWIRQGEHDVILINAFQDGSPESLNDPAGVAVYDYEDWTSGVSFDGITARDGLNLMAQIKKCRINFF
jgi:hypothetical protein